MNLHTKQRLKKLFGYPAFFLFAFWLMLFLTFPYDLIGERAHQAAAAAGWELSFRSIGPGLFGVTAKGVSIGPKKKESILEAPKTLLIDKVKLRPSLFPLGVAFDASLGGGSLGGAMSLFGDLKVEVRGKGVDLGKTNLADLAGFHLGGSVNLALDLKTEKRDLVKSVGRLSLSGERMNLSGVKAYGFELPETDLGRLDSEFKIEGGKASIVSCRLAGADLDAIAEGEIILASHLPLSALRVKLKMKPADAYLQKNSLVRNGLTMAMTKDKDGYFGASLERALGNPQFKPLR